MKSFDYHRPTSLSELNAALAGAPDARPLAGGMTLIPTLKMRLATPPALVDLRALRHRQCRYGRRDDHARRDRSLD